MTARACVEIEFAVRDIHRVWRKQKPFRSSITPPPQRHRYQKPAITVKINSKTAPWVPLPRLPPFSHGGKTYSPRREIAHRFPPKYALAPPLLRPLQLCRHASKCCECSVNKSAGWRVDLSE